MVAGVFLSGCSLVSDPTLLEQSIVERQPDPNGWSNISASLRAMKKIHSYELKASLVVTADKFTKTVTYFGDVTLPDTVSLNETIDGVNTTVFQKGRSAYVNDGSGWQTAPPVGNMAPWNPLYTWFSHMRPRTIYRLPDQPVLSYECHVYQFEGQLPQSMAGLAPDAGSNMTPQKALFTLWIERNNDDLRQLEVQSSGGVPSVGTVAITATQLYASLNSPMHLLPPRSLRMN